MSILTPRTTFTFHQNIDEEVIRSYFTDKLNGRNAFEVEGVFGKKKVVYEGSIEFQQYYLDRSADSFKMQIYPTTVINVSGENDGVTVSVTIRLSAIWKLFVYSVYLFILAGTFFSIYGLHPSQNYVVFIVKVLGSVLIFNAVIFAYHFSEVKNIKKVIDKLRREIE